MDVFEKRVDSLQPTAHSLRQRSSAGGNPLRLGKPGTDGTFSDILLLMARLARVIAVNLPHHVTQRGNARQFLFVSDGERNVYLDLLRRYIELYRLSLLGYCLMSNHVHLVVVPCAADSLGLALKHTHGRYASFWNAAHGSSGHVWQGRFYSCPLDNSHLWIALRYTELNPVRAGLVSDAKSWTWSSARAHCGCGEADVCLDTEKFSRRWSTEGWQEYLATGESEAELAAIRRCTHTGRPLGTPQFIQSLEQIIHRDLAVKKGGRPASSMCAQDQKILTFDK